MNMMPRQSSTILFYLTPEFTMLAFSSALESLRLANQALKRDAYDWRLVSSDGKPVKASCGISIATDISLTQARAMLVNGAPPRMAMVCAGRNVQNHCDRELLGWLRECRNKRVAIGAICTGAHLLARTGLLNNKRCTIHWENYSSFAEEFPTAELSSHIFEIDDGIYTCAGGTTPLEMMLELIGHDCGMDVAVEVCQQAVLASVRDRSERQRLPFAIPGHASSPNLRKVIRLMEENITDPLALGTISDRIGISRRQMERYFRTVFDCSPHRYYLRLRIERAKSLLQQTSMQIVDIAIACGFVSASHFSKTFRQLLGESPGECRQERVIKLSGWKRNGNRSAYKEINPNPDALEATA